jgi:hypothetical protein
MRREEEEIISETFSRTRSEVVSLKRETEEKVIGQEAKKRIGVFRVSLLRTAMVSSAI